MQIKVWWPILFVVSIILTCVLIFPSELRLADLLGRSGNLDEAIAGYQRVLRANPRRLDLRLELSRLYITRGEFTQAIAQIEQAGVASVTDVFTLGQLADIYSEIGDRAKTVSTLRRIVDLNPDDAAVRRKLADAYQWNSDTEQAIQAYDEILRKNPADAEILYKLATLSLSVQDYGKAALYLDKYVELEPDDIWKRELLASIYLKLQQPDFAAIEYEQVLKADPDNEAIRQRLAEIYLLEDKYDRGLAHYERLVQQHRLNEDYFDRLITLTENYDPAKSILYYKLRLKYLPQDNVLRERLYDQYVHLGMTDEAAGQMQLLASRNPQDPTYWSDLAYLYQDIQRPEQAKETFEQLIATGFFSKDIFDELKLYYKEDKEFGKLVGLFGRIQETDLYDLATQREHAYFLAFTRLDAQAIASYEDIVSVDPGDAASRMQLAELYRRANDGPGAYRVVKNGLENYLSDDGPFLLYTAQLLNDQKRYAESIEVYQQLANLNGQDGIYRVALIELYLKTGEFEKVGALQHELVRADPENSQLKFDYAALNWLRNKPAEVHRILDQIRLAHGDEPGIQQRIATFYFEHGYFPEAIEQTKTNLESAPQDSLGLRTLALSYAWNNQPVAAGSALRHYHSLYPNDYYTRYHLGILYHDLDKSGDADLEFEQALGQLVRATPTKQTRLVQANILAYQKLDKLAIKIYRGLVADFPDDPNILTDYSHGMIILKQYASADALLTRALATYPNDYRLQRLQALSYFEQGNYSEARAAFRALLATHPRDMGLAIDLADSQLLAGDWLASTKTLGRLLNETPDYGPAQQRLLQLRREQSEAVAFDYRYEEQSDTFMRQVANVIFEKAASSLLSLKLLFSQENYSSSTGGFTDEDYQQVGIGLSSSINSRVSTSALAKAQWHQNIFQMTGHGTLQWKFDPENSFALTADINSIWRDPLSAAFFDGRLHRLQTDLNLTLWKNIILWNRFSQEQHFINHSEEFGEAKRAYVQVGYRWPLKPSLLTYYQLYNINYSYEVPGNKNIISIPQNETTHFLGTLIEQQLTTRFYYQIGGSIGVKADRNAAQYYATAHLEYNLLRNLRLRSRFEFGRQNTLTGNEANKVMSVDFFYFH